MNKLYAIKRMLFAVLAVLSIGVLAKNTAYAADDFSIVDFSYYNNRNMDSMHCNVSVNNPNITALVYQVIDSNGETVLIKTGKVCYGSSSVYCNTGLDLADGEYTMVVSDFNGKYSSVEQKFSVVDTFECYMYLRGNDSITAVVDLYVPERYKKLSIDGTEFDLADTKELNVNGAIFRREGKTRRYTYMKDVPAKNFDDKINIYFYEEDETEMIGGEQEPMVSYSVRDYLKQRLSNEYNVDYAVCKALNDYGYAAQTYFNYNAPDSPVVIDDVGDLSAYKSEVKGSCPGLEYIGSSLILDGTVAIRHYFTGNPAGLEASISGDGVEDYKVQIVEAGDVCYIEIRNILASKLDTPFDLAVWQHTVSGNNVGFRLKNYSVLTYCDKAISNSKSNPKLANVTKALVQYNKECKALYKR